jgi:DNA-binding MarR family transcriptional regulator
LQAEAVDLGVLLALAYGDFVSQLRAALAEQGFGDHGPSFGYVARILDKREATVSEIAELLGLSNQGAVKILDELEAGDYVRRVADAADGRVRRVQLTARGRRTLAAARAFHRDFEASLAERVGPRRAAAFRAVLSELADDGEASPAARVARPM